MIHERTWRSAVPEDYFPPWAAQVSPAAFIFSSLSFCSLLALPLCIALYISINSWPVTIFSASSALHLQAWSQTGCCADVTPGAARQLFTHESMNAARSVAGHRPGGSVVCGSCPRCQMIAPTIRATTVTPPRIAESQRVLLDMRLE